MFKGLFTRPVMIPVIIVACLWLVGQFAGVLTGEMNLASWISEHRVLLGLILAWVVIRYTTPLKYTR